MALEQGYPGTEEEFKKKEKKKLARGAAAIVTAIGLAFSGGGGQKAEAASDPNSKTDTKTKLETAGTMPSQENLAWLEEGLAGETEQRQAFLNELVADGPQEKQFLDPEKAKADFINNIEVVGEQGPEVKQFILSLFDAQAESVPFLSSNRESEGQYLVDKIINFIPASSQEQTLKISGDGSLGTQEGLVRSDQQQDSGYWNNLNIGVFPAGVEVMTDGHGNRPSGQLFINGERPSLEAERRDISFQLQEGQEHLLEDGEKRPYTGINAAFTVFAENGEIAQQVKGTFMANEQGKIVFNPTEVIGVDKLPTTEQEASSMAQEVMAGEESLARQTFIDALPIGGTAENNYIDPRRSEMDLQSKIEFSSPQGQVIEKFVTSFWDPSVDEQEFRYSNANVAGENDLRLIDRVDVTIPASIKEQVLKISGDGSISINGNLITPEERQDAKWWNTLSFAKIPAHLETITNGKGNIPAGQLIEITGQEGKLSQISEVGDIFRQLTEGQHHLDMQPYQGLTAVFAEYDQDGSIKTKVAGTFTLDRESNKVVFNPTEVIGLPNN